MSSVPKGTTVVQYLCVDVAAVVSYLECGWVLYGSPFFNPTTTSVNQAVIRVVAPQYDSD